MKKNKSFDFKNEEHISDVLEIFRKVKEYHENNGHEVKNYVRLYFIDKTGVYYYDTTDKGEISILQQIKNNDYYIEPCITENPPVKLKQQFKNNQELLSFCKNEILECANKDYKIDLKDKFSSIIFDNNEVYFDNSVKNNKELSLSLIAGDYNELE